MSALGQKRTLEDFQAMSALPPKADIANYYWHVRFVPEEGIAMPKQGVCPNQRKTDAPGKYSRTLP
jgi:hypothetical protein